MQYVIHMQDPALPLMGNQIYSFDFAECGSDAFAIHNARQALRAADFPAPEFVAYLQLESETEGCIRPVARFFSDGRFETESPQS